MLNARTVAYSLLLSSSNRNEWPNERANESTKHNCSVCFYLFQLVPMYINRVHNKFPLRARNERTSEWANRTNDRICERTHAHIQTKKLYSQIHSQPVSQPAVLHTIRYIYTDVSIEARVTLSKRHPTHTHTHTRAHAHTHSTYRNDLRWYEAPTDFVCELVHVFIASTII